MQRPFFCHVTGFYRDYGVGMFGLNKAFRIAGNEDGTVRFLPINNMDAVMLDDLIGYELQKKSWWIIPASWREGLPTMSFYLEIPVQENPPASRPL